MLPENLVPARFHLSAVETGAAPEGKEPDFPQDIGPLSEHAQNILANASRSGQSRNMLLEEHDRHIKERLFRVVKIETFARLLNDLQAEGEIDAQTLSKIISDKTQTINDAGNEIWLKLITREKDEPIFYKLGDE